MRNLLVGLIALEGLALIVAGATLLFGLLDDVRAEPPPVPVFRPPIYEARAGDRVRYEKLDRESGDVLGYLEYRFERAEEFRGTMSGREFLVTIVERSRDGRERSRLMRLLPRSVNHGFLPPIYDEDIRVEAPGERPVVRTIRTAPVRVFRREVPGFLVETVIPRRSLTDVAERYWVTPQVPGFGVARWETRDGVYVLHTMEKSAP